MKGTGNGDLVRVGVHRRVAGVQRGVCGGGRAAATLVEIAISLSGRSMGQQSNNAMVGRA